jgi:cytochrome c553
MHARASDDPLFVAMSRRAQRETDGGIGALCFRCHAPMALAAGAAPSAIDPARLPSSQQGVTCAFCHAVDAVNGTSDDPLHLATDGVLRGPILDPIATPSHASAYSALLDRDDTSSAPLCGACHDVVLTNGFAAERTFAEWRGSVYAQPSTLVTCGKCHMAGAEGYAASAPNLVPPRTVHDHTMAAVDVPLDAVDAGDFLGAAQATLDPAVSARLCVASSGGASVTLFDAVAGHDFPSGAVHDRRAWVELVATAAGATVLASGLLPDDQTSVTSLADPNIWLLGGTLQSAAGTPVLFLWEATSLTASTLPVATTYDASAPGYVGGVARSYPIPAGTDTVTMRVRLAPVALEVVASLIASGDLDPSYQARLPVYTLAGTVLEWKAGGPACVGVP